MTHDARFGELRSILQRPASLETWDALCQHLDLWELDMLEAVALPYTLDIIHRWPNELERSAPRRWIERLLGGEDAALVALANKLRLDGALRSSALTALLSSPHLTNLTALHLHESQLGDEGAAALAASPNLTDLTSLNLYDNLISDAGAAAFATSPHLTSLADLDLSYNYIYDHGAAALAASPHLSKLTALHLSNNLIGAEGAAALAASPHLHESIRAQRR